MKPRVIGKGLIEKRGRILRCLAAHVGYLEMVERLHPWWSPPRQERPARPPDPDPYRAMTAAHYYPPREKPELKYPAPGPEALSEEEVKAWVELDPFVRGGLSPRTARALTFISTFAPRSRA